MSGQANNDKVYLYYSRNSTAIDSNVDGDWLDNRLSQFTWNGSALVDETLLQTFGTHADGESAGPNHNGGPITFGPDGKLYGISGDVSRNRAEQNNENEAGNSSFVGGVYRLNDNGTVPADNPFSGHANSDFHRWYAYGIRNSFGLAFDPATGFLWDTENGPESYDEINLVAPGFNSGWLDIMGPDARDPQGTDGLVNLALGGVSTYSDPEFSWLNSIAPTAIHFLHGSALGAVYNDKVFVADFNNSQIYLFTLKPARDGFVLAEALSDLVADDATERDQLLLGSGFGVVTDFVRGPDGYIYAVSLFTGKIFRIFQATGDYNKNGVVDAADYIVWRDTLGETSDPMGKTFLAADHSGATTGVPNGVVDQFDYDFWRGHFGHVAGSGAGASVRPPITAVPEPASFWTALVGILAMRACRRASLP
jgi:glucose/arabinose dehydrogenase